MEVYMKISNYLYSLLLSYGKTEVLAKQICTFYNKATAYVASAAGYSDCRTTG